MRAYALPPPVRAPLGIYVHAEQLEGALAPWVQTLQSLEQPTLLLLVEFVGAANTHAGIQLHAGGTVLGKQGKTGLPAGQIAVATGILQSLIQRLWQIVQTVIQRGMDRKSVV